MNNTVYDCLMALNVMENAYTDWAEYRAAVTSYILSHTKAGSTAVIVGAGACNDVDLRVLSAHFSMLTLADIDVAAVHRGMADQAADEKKITVVEADIVGIGDAAFRTFSIGMEKLARSGVKELTGPFLYGIRSLFANRDPDRFYTEARYDSVICLGVHSQLLAVFPRIAGVFARAGLLDPDRIEPAVSSMNEILMPEVNGKLLSMANEGTIFGIESERRGIPGGIEGAKQAMDDLRASKRVSLCDPVSVTWPFRPGADHIYQVDLVYANCEATGACRNEI